MYVVGTYCFFITYMLWVLIRGTSNKYPKYMLFNGEWEELSWNYYQILFLNKTSEISLHKLDKLILKTLGKIAADDILFFFSSYFQR